MIKIALAGNIAAGKSAVENILKDYGYNVLDTDKVSHGLLTAVNVDLYNIFKDYDVFENGEFSREKLGYLVFSNPVLKSALESILHPLIEIEIKKFFSDNNNEDILFVSVPLVFEAGMERLFDKIIFVYSDDNLRLERLIKRNNYSADYAKLRLDSQMPQEYKVKKSDYVLYNNGTQDELKYSVMRLLKSLRE